MIPDQRVASYVFVGKFVPSDLQLNVLAESNAISSIDRASAELEALVPGQLLAINFQWGKLTALQDRLTIDVRIVPYIRGADLALKIFREISPGSVVQKFGINLVSHYDFHGATARDEFAGKLVPLQEWGAFGQTVQQSFSETDTRHGGLLKVTVRNSMPSDRSAGWKDVTVEPSPKSLLEYGVTISINDHFEIFDEPSNVTNRNERTISEELLTKFEEKYDSSLELSQQICNDLTRRG